MAVCPIVTTDATPAGLLQAYSGEDEEFYGLDEEGSQMSSNKQLCSDEDELSDSDLESEALRRGCLDSVDWNSGMDWNGMVEWNRREPIPAVIHTTHAYGFASC